MSRLLTSRPFLAPCIERVKRTCLPRCRAEARDPRAAHQPAPVAQPDRPSRCPSRALRPSPHTSPIALGRSPVAVVLWLQASAVPADLALGAAPRLLVGGPGEAGAGGARLGGDEGARAPAGLCFTGRVEDFGDAAADAGVIEVHEVVSSTSWGTPSRVMKKASSPCGGVEEMGVFGAVAGGDQCQAALARCAAPHPVGLPLIDVLDAAVGVGGRERVEALEEEAAFALGGQVVGLGEEFASPRDQREVGAPQRPLPGRVAGGAGRVWVSASYSKTSKHRGGPAVPLPMQLFTPRTVLS